MMKYFCIAAAIIFSSTVQAGEAVTHTAENMEANGPLAEYLSNDDVSYHWTFAKR